MDMREYVLRRIEEAKPAMEWQAGSREAMAEWQFELRNRLARVVGGILSERPPMWPEIVETRDFPGYRRETVRFETRPGLELVGYFLTPDGADSPRPGVLCLPGHGRGVDSIVGIAADGSQRPLGAPDEYQADFALQCVGQGYPVFAVEQMSFGHRRDRRVIEAGADASSCKFDSMAAWMLGESMIGWRVWDAMRGLDYLQMRPEVDPQRLVTMGISGGGLTSLFTGALDTRVGVCVVSGYFNTFRDSVLAVDHCVDNYAAGLLNLIEMPDLAALIAPRALFVESGTRDDIFPLPAFKRAVARAEGIYTAFGVPDRFGSEVFEGEHLFHGTGAFAFLYKDDRSRTAG